MVVVNIFLLLIPAILAAQYFLNSAGLLEKLGVVIFFSLTAVPFLNINCALLNGNYMSNNLTFINSVILIIFFSILILCRKQKNDLQQPAFVFVLKNELWVLAILVFIAGCAAYYYSNKEFILSLGSYFIKGDAECFYQQAFRVIKELNPDFKSSIPVNEVYGIICTPGNILFTSTVLPIFKLYSFQIVYVLFVCLLFIFVYLIVTKLLTNRIIALLTALFAVLNPYVLSVEVLDRNVMALSISAILFYLLLEHKNKIFLHGLVFGILAGTGLRFIPLLFVFPIAIIYHKEILKLKTIFIFMPAFIITFTFNTPHFYFHGLNSLGEKVSSWPLIFEAFTKYTRTPFLPFPNILFYLFNILNYFGYLICAIVLLGVFKLWKTDKRMFSALASFFLLILFVLSYQRNWMEGDKCRIILEGFLPIYVFFAYGLRELFVKKSVIKKSALTIASLILLAIFARILIGVNFNQENDFYNRQYLFQEESRSYYILSKKFFYNVSLFPNYERLFAKRDIKGKKLEAALMLKRVFSADTLPGHDKFKDFYSAWGKYFLKKSDGKYKYSLPHNYKYVQIDFDKLATDFVNSVKIIDYADICSVDLMKTEDLFEVYYDDLIVSWQKKALPVCVMINKDEIEYLNTFYIELNAFTGFGKDASGFDVVNSVNFKADKKLEKVGLLSGVGSFPLFADKNKMVFHVPKDLRIIIRNWFVNEKGIPYKIDSWCFKQDKKGNYRADFFYNEPESYL